MRGLDTIIGGDEDERVKGAVPVHIVHDSSPMPPWEVASIAAGVASAAVIVVEFLLRRKRR